MLCQTWRHAKCFGTNTTHKILDTRVVGHMRSETFRLIKFAVMNFKRKISFLRLPFPNISSTHASHTLHSYTLTPFSWVFIWYLEFLAMILKQIGHSSVSSSWPSMPLDVLWLFMCTFRFIFRLNACVVGKFKNQYWNSDAIPQLHTNLFANFAFKPPLRWLPVGPFFGIVDHFHVFATSGWRSKSFFWKGNC